MQKPTKLPRNAKSPTNKDGLYEYGVFLFTVGAHSDFFGDSDFFCAASFAWACIASAFSTA